VLLLSGWVAGAALSFVLGRHAREWFLRHFPAAKRHANIDRLIHPRHRLWSLVLLRMTFPVDVLSHSLGLFSRSTTLTENVVSTALGAAPFAVMFALIPTLSRHGPADRFRRVRADIHRLRTMGTTPHLGHDAGAGVPMQPRHFETVIIGTGFSGLLAAIRLRKRRCNDFVLLERSAELGGTWQANSYPGAEVDIPTALYCISFIPYPFRKTFSPQSELLAYTNHVIDRFDLRRHARTNQTVTRLAFDERELLWHVETESGERYSARFVIDSSGVLANPHVPIIKGAETFRGPKFHAGHWDHSVDYEGRRVGVIGSGCSAAQIVPAIAGKVSRLTLFMGKAQWILPRSDRNYGRVERFVRTLPGIRHVIRFLVFVFYDLRFVAFRRYPGISGIGQFMKDHYRRRLKKHLEKYIKDDDLRRHMMPDYELGCRRVIPTNAYLPALSLDNVDVDVSGIECITPTGIRTKDGKDIPWISSFMPPDTSRIRT
jgi:cation diffusion facilitator CzcD-associated flavoprotein CzcO